MEGQAAFGGLPLHLSSGLYELAASCWHARAVLPHRGGTYFIGTAGDRGRLSGRPACAQGVLPGGSGMGIYPARERKKMLVISSGLSAKSNAIQALISAEAAPAKKSGGSLLLRTCSRWICSSVCVYR